jgi:hypothetical protein
MKSTNQILRRGRDAVVIAMVAISCTAQHAAPPPSLLDGTWIIPLVKMTGMAY